MALDDPEFNVRRTAIQWVGEERLTHFRPSSSDSLPIPTSTPDLFEAALASLEMLDRRRSAASKNEFSGADYALRLARDERAGDSVRSIALRMVPPGHKGLDFRAVEAAPCRVVGFSPPRGGSHAPRNGLPRDARDAARLSRPTRKADISVRLEAIAGLATVLQRDEHDRATVDVLAAIARRLRMPSFRVAALQSRASVPSKFPRFEPP